METTARRQFEFSARQNIAERVIPCYILHMKIKFVRKSAKTLDTRAARFSQLTANSKYLFHIQNISSQKVGRDELGFDGHNLVYRPLRVLTKVKTRVKQFYFRDGR